MVFAFAVDEELTFTLPTSLVSHWTFLPFVLALSTPGIIFFSSKRSCWCMKGGGCSTAFRRLESTAHDFACSQ